MTNYQIADFLIRLKNASLAGNRELVVPSYKLNFEVANVLVREGFLESVTKDKHNLIIKMAIRSKKHVLSSVKIMSRPGLRIYINVNEIEKYNKPEVLILSTPQGILSQREAIKKRVGGELIAKVI